MTDSEWIIVTVRDSGYRKPVRRAAVLSYGTLGADVTFIDIAGKTIEVRESEAEIARMVGSFYVGGVDIRPQLIEAEHERMIAEMEAKHRENVELEAKHRG